MGLGGGQNEDDMRRWLFQYLEQRIEGFSGQHVDFVHYVDFHAPLHGGEVRVVSDVPDIVNAAVGGGVYLDDIQRLPASYGLAARAAAIGADGGRSLARLAVQRHSQDLRSGGLAGATRPGEEVGVADAVLLDGVDQRSGHVILADHVLEANGPVFAVEGD